MDGGYLDADERRQRTKKLIFYIAAVLIAWAVVGGAMYTYWAKYGVSSEDRFDRELDADPVMALALEPLGRLYPYEYKRLREAAAFDYNVDRHRRVIDHMPGDFIKKFRQRHAYEALMGGKDEKLAFMAAQGDLFEAALTDPKVCHMLVGNEVQMSDMALVFSTKPFARMFGAFVTVAASGLKPHEPDTSSAEDDIADLTRAMRKLDPNPGPIERGDDAGYCKREALTFQALRSLPPEQQVRLASRIFQVWR